MTKREKFVLWLNKVGRGCNRITICVLYITNMLILATLIFSATQQKATSNITVNYSRPSYTVTFDPQGGGVSPSTKTVKLGDNYGDLPTPTREGYVFAGWQNSDGTTVTSTTQNTTIGDHTLTAKWKMNNKSYLSPNWAKIIYDAPSNASMIYGGLTEQPILGAVPGPGVNIYPYETILFTKEESQIAGLTNSVSVGTNSETSTSAYVTSDTISDVRAYWGSDKSTIVIYSIGTIYAPKSCSYLFSGSGDYSIQFSSLESLQLDNFDTSKVTDMSDMFFASSLTSLDVSNFDTSKVTNMHTMFYNCSSLTSLDVSNFDTSNVTDMEGMFDNCSKLTSLDLSNFNTSKVTDMSHMFYNCFSLTSLDLGNFNLESCTNFDYMFYNIVTYRASRAISSPASCELATIVLPYNLQSGKNIYLPYNTRYVALYSKNGSGSYYLIGTTTVRQTVACSTENEKVTLQFVKCVEGGTVN